MKGSEEVEHPPDRRAAPEPTGVRDGKLGELVCLCEFVKAFFSFP